MYAKVYYPALGLASLKFIPCSGLQYNTTPHHINCLLWYKITLWKLFGGRCTSWISHIISEAMGVYCSGIKINQGVLGGFINMQEGSFTNKPNIT